MNDYTTPQVFKCCNKCGHEFPATSEFWHKNSIEKDGLCRTCKECAKARARQWSVDNSERDLQAHKSYYAQHREHIKQRVREYARNHPDEIKMRNADYHARNKADRNAKNREYAHAHAKERDQRVSAWIAEHPERRKATANRYGKTSKGAAARLKRRAREHNLPDTFTADQWLACLEWWCHACAYCGATGVKLTADHFIPLADPECPGTVAWNIVPACKQCNSSKGKSDPIEWLAKRLPELERHEVFARIAVYLNV